MKGARRHGRQVTGVKKRRKEDDRRGRGGGMEKDRMMNEGSKKAGRASDRAEEGKEGR